MVVLGRYINPQWASSRKCGDFLTGNPGRARREAGNISNGCHRDRGSYWEQTPWCGGGSISVTSVTRQSDDSTLLFKFSGWDSSRARGLPARREHPERHQQQVFAITVLMRWAGVGWEVGSHSFVRTGNSWVHGTSTHCGKAGLRASLEARKDLESD